MTQTARPPEPLRAPPTTMPFREPHPVQAPPMAVPARPTHPFPVPPPPPVAVEIHGLKRKRDEDLEIKAPVAEAKVDLAALFGEKEVSEPEKKKPRIDIDPRIERIFDLAKIGSIQAFKEALTPDLMEAQDREGYSLLHRVVLEKREVKFIRVLISAGFPINKPGPLGNTALHVAVNIQSKKHVQELLKQSADRTVTNQAGKTPVQMCTGRGPIKIRELFTEETKDKD